MSTVTPSVCTETVEADCLGLTERGGKVARKGGSLHPGLQRCREITDRESERKRETERGKPWGKGNSVASWCPRQEERELCAVDCLTETQAVG